MRLNPNSADSAAIRTPKRLWIRLGSFGDLVLATLPLEDPSVADAFENHWIVKKEWAPLLSGHPSIHTVWSYDRKTGLKGWVALAELLHLEGFTSVVDLHNTLRSRLLVFFLRALRAFSLTAALLPGAGLRWNKRFKLLRVSKQRFRLYGYFCFKGLWPKAFRPSLWAKRYLAIVGSTQYASDLSGKRFGFLKEAFPSRVPSSFFCVMPSSAWESKKWASASFFETVEHLLSAYPQMKVLILGLKTDIAAEELRAKLDEKFPGRQVEGGGQLTLPQLPFVLSHAKVLLSNDTGLTHLAEAVGTPTVTLFGPTTPEVGFSPLLTESQSLGASLWCRPCGKDGRNCIRPVRKYLCLSSLSCSQVVQAMRNYF